MRVNDAEERWFEIEQALDEKVLRVREIERLLTSLVEIEERDMLLEELRRLYWWTFNSSKIKGLVEAMRALSPGPAVMLVIGLSAAPVPSDNASAVYISRQGIARLLQWLWNELAKDAAGQPHRIAAGPYRQSLFYAATGSYDMTHTCNTWTAEALRVAGLPVRAAGVVFAEDITAQLAPFAAPSPAPQQVSR